MAPREPDVRSFGLFAKHDQRCAILSGRHAVYECGTGIFHPSWEAQTAGWRLIRAQTRFQRWLLRTFFGDQP